MGEDVKMTEIELGESGLCPPDAMGKHRFLDRSFALCTTRAYSPDSLLTSTDSLRTSTDSLPTSTEFLQTYTHFN